MSKVCKRIAVMCLSLVCASSLFVGCAVQATPTVNKEAPLSEPAQKYDGEVKDADGNLLVPFDVAYPEAFASGEYRYDENVLLLKMAKGTASLSRKLKKCGFSSLEKFASAEDGDWLRAGLKKGTDIHTALQKARALDEVLLADYDYIYQAEAAETATESNSAETSGLGDIIDDVLSNLQVKDQWYLTSSEIQRSWRYLKENDISAGGLGSVTVAVIDTGVDYNHPDLAANMWVNTAEIPNNGIDDDGNGYIDDIYGCNTIADNGGADGNEGDPMDDHGHGTHVAGIIGAANNREGIVGVAYNAKIMAVKAGQATGVFNQSDIAEAILYAYDMGADVINMSFGGSACSIAVQDVLSTAYTRSTLVASAGNSGMPNEMTDFYEIPLPNYPAALSYVIGVMSVNSFGMESGFTNWDAVAYNSVEYEMYAPGEAIMSTLPNGRYGKLSGTSMAAPVVSGAAALLRSYFTDRDMYPSKFIAAQLAATSEDEAICCNPEKHVVNGGPHNLPMRLNVYDAFTKLPKPDVRLYTSYLFDDERIAEGNNGDGVIDAGETVEIGAVLRNRWGMSENTIVSIDSNSDSGIANPYVEILTDSANFAGVGTYSTKDLLIREENGKVTGVESPLKVKIADNCPNDYLIRLNVTVVCENGLDDKDGNIYTTWGTIEFWVRNGVVLPGQITEDQTWTKDNYYIIPSLLYIAEGATVTVEPGTQIQCSAMLVAGKFLAQGSEENPIIMLSIVDGTTIDIRTEANGYIELKYLKISNPQLIHVQNVDYCDFQGDIRLDDVVISNSSFLGHITYRDCIITKSVFNCSLPIDNSAIIENCVFIHSKNSSSWISMWQTQRSEVTDYYYDDINNVMYLSLQTYVNSRYSNIRFIGEGAMRYAQGVAKLLGGIDCLRGNIRRMVASKKFRI